jgi:low affinity Fe/Cu permease
LYEKGDFNALSLQGWQLQFNLGVTVLIFLKNVMLGSHKYAITTVQCTVNHIIEYTQKTLNLG